MKSYLFTAFLASFFAAPPRIPITPLPPLFSYLQEDPLLGPLPAIKESLPAPTDCRPLDIMVMIDNTLSMQNYSVLIRNQVQDFINTIFSARPDSRIALSTSADRPHPYSLVHPFTNNIPSLQKALGKISTVSGIDTPEGYAHALRLASNEAWNPEAYRLLILYADSETRSSPQLKESIETAPFVPLIITTNKEAFEYWEKFAPVVSYSQKKSLTQIADDFLKQACSFYCFLPAQQQLF